MQVECEDPACLPPFPASISLDPGQNTTSDIQHQKPTHSPKPGAASESGRQGEVSKEWSQCGSRWGNELNCLPTSSSLIPVGSLAVLDVQVEKIEDQKLYMSCIAQSRDKQTVYAKSSGKETCSLGLPTTLQPTTKGREEEG